MCTISFKEGRRRTILIFPICTIIRSASNDQPIRLRLRREGEISHDNAERQRVAPGAEDSIPMLITDTISIAVVRLTSAQCCLHDSKRSRPGQNTHLRHGAGWGSGTAVRGVRRLQLAQACPQRHGLGLTPTRRCRSRSLQPDQVSLRTRYVRLHDQT